MPSSVVAQSALTGADAVPKRSETKCGVGVYSWWQYPRYSHCPMYFVERSGAVLACTDTTHESCFLNPGLLALHVR